MTVFTYDQNAILVISHHEQHRPYIVAVMSNHDGGASPLADGISRILARIKTQESGLSPRP